MRETLKTRDHQSMIAGAKELMVVKFGLPNFTAFATVIRPHFGKAVLTMRVNKINPLPTRA